MSDQRPEWMASDEEMRRAIYGMTFGDPGEGVTEMAHRTGLRAQIAVLEEEDLHMVNFFEGTYNDENRMYRQDKIAALRKELE